jgi:hypothetical protein
MILIIAIMCIYHKQGDKFLIAIIRKAFEKVKFLLMQHKQHIKIAVKRVYSIITVLSTLTIFSALLFIVGKTGFGVSCDDDLIMKNIQSQVPDNLIISNIYVQDIHGFKNDSIIVLTTNDNGTKIANQLIIYDKINNYILNKLNNLFGYGSNYKLTYSFSLDDPNFDEEFSFGYSLKILDMIDLTGDLSKEIIVQFMAWPAGTSGYYQIGIFSYSYEKKNYYLLGTYPPAVQFDEDAWQYPDNVPTTFHTSTASQKNYYNDSEVFQLEYGTMDDNDFFVKSGYATYLIRTCMIWGNESHVEPHRHVISVFTPRYNIETDELEWTVIFSQKTDDYIDYCTREFVQDFLNKNEKSWIMQG